MAMLFLEEEQLLDASINIGAYNMAHDLAKLKAQFEEMINLGHSRSPWDNACPSCFFSKV